ncbi:E3 ubiquitin/ISG15 ligase TRIM25 isoform X3 [Anguilla anguilla]|uniref:E3 ubiquitin/ISG15 ligase TRIM25 isoform X3 n=1 Tax=Anguilla anguilla TaxID=7936 RepID=UPI0015ADAB14|nr:E3 ubiquitin/ISG15 ligase TRIM25 isoform X3 [Anguilla anguilla]
MESLPKDIFVKIAKSLKCWICFEVFNDPATSSCGKHTYCLECLKKHCEGKVRSCPECRKEFHKGYKPQKNIALCNIVSICSRPYLDDILSNEDLPSSAKKPEVADESEHNLQTLKRKLTHLTSEIKSLDDILSKKCKTKEQSKLDVPSQDVDLGQNLGESLQENPLPAELSTVAWQQQDAEQTPEQPVTLLQLEGGPSDSHGEEQGVSMELGTEAEEAGPSAGLNDCLERLSFSPQLAHKYLIFSDDNRRVQVRRRSLGRPPSHTDRFDVSQAMADQEFSSGVHYWEVDTSQSSGWAIGVAYSGLGRGEKLGRTPSSWCLEWSSSKLCYWHGNHSEHIKHECPSKVRVMLDMDSGSLAFSSTTDNLILLHSVEVQFTRPVRPAFWLYGLKPGNSLALVVP